MAGPPTLALVHSPLVGPMTWVPAAEGLRDRGFPVAVCSPAGGPPYYPRMAEAAARSVAGTGDVVLVGHSGAGALLPAIADVLGGRVRGAVFVDALLPHPGSSWFDTAPEPLREHLTALVRDGRLPPWNEWFPADAIEALLPDAEVRERFVGELPRLPIAYFEEPAPAPAGWTGVGCHYVRLSEAYDRAADEAQRRGWTVVREDADHLAPLTRPERISDLIARVTRTPEPG